MRLFRSDRLPRLQPQSDGMAFSQEIKILAFTDPELSCPEMPVFYGEHRVGESQPNLWRDGFGNLFHLFQVRLRLVARRHRAPAPPSPVAGAVRETYA
jgi:hypothetical protein